MIRFRGCYWFLKRMSYGVLILKEIRQVLCKALKISALQLKNCNILNVKDL